LQNPPPAPPSHRANFFERLDYLVRAAVFLVAEGLNTRHSLETIMTQSDDLTTEVSNLGTNLADVSARIDKEVNDLAIAVAASGQPNPAIDTAITNLRAANSQLVAMSSKLAADDAPAPPSGP
jgi:predicted  nucleic acid-binding Zn-ribbon protein